MKKKLECAEPATMPILRRVMPELDALRGVAVLMVVCYHGLFWSNGGRDLDRFGQVVLTVTKVGWTGVNLFFVLSGFLISGILLDTRNRSRREYFKVFYARRALRILPLYYLVLIVVSLMLATTRQVSLCYFLLCVVYLTNFASFFGVGAGYPLGVLWSLAIEEQFYLVWPLVVRLCRPKVLLAVCGFIVLASPVGRAAAFYNTGHDLGYTITWHRLDGLALGSGLAAFLRIGAPSRKQLALFAVAAMGASVFAAVVGWPYGIGTRNTLIGSAGQPSCIDLFFVGLLALMLLMGSSSLARFVTPAGLRYIGGISYGMYLIHQTALWLIDQTTVWLGWKTPRPGGWTTVMVLARFVVGFLATVLVCHLSYYRFEAYFLSLKRWFPYSDVERPEAVSRVEPVGFKSPRAGLQSGVDQ